MCLTQCVSPSAVFPPTFCSTWYSLYIPLRSPTPTILVEGSPVPSSRSAYTLPPILLSSHFCSQVATTVCITITTSNAICLVMKLPVLVSLPAYRSFSGLWHNINPWSPTLIIAGSLWYLSLKLNDRICLCSNWTVYHWHSQWTIYDQILKNIPEALGLQWFWSWWDIFEVHIF